jgi:hypothetical protein
LSGDQSADRPDGKKPLSEGHGAGLSPKIRFRRDFCQIGVFPPADPENYGQNLTPVGYLFMTYPARRFAPKTVRQDSNAVRQELEPVSDSIGIRR